MIIHANCFSEYLVASHQIVIAVIIIVFVIIVVVIINVNSYDNEC